jgi:hypothetical protein
VRCARVSAASEILVRVLILVRIITMLLRQCLLRVLIVLLRVLVFLVSALSGVGGIREACVCVCVCLAPDRSLGLGGKAERVRSSG